MDVRYYWGDWAEESLLQAERALLLLGTPPPTWMVNKNYYHDNVVTKTYITHEEILPTATSNFENELLKWVLLPVALVVTVMAIVCVVKRNRNKQTEGYSLIP
jgi:hypothetical protein